ncbi:MAG: DUF4835 family protein [Bacteroidota bacterium]|nr:DUF4835 family protein [Candidatus Kapabacteria bacterium]MDW8220511.1 DUF4835 family protein [Bacteroidota bacterium]
MFYIRLFNLAFLNILVCCIGIWSAVAHGQEIRATVSVDFAPGFDINEQDNFASFRQELQTYFNTQIFTGKEWKSEEDKILWKDEPVQLNVTITLLSGTQTSYYNATLLVVAKRTLYGTKKQSVTMQILDTKLKFPYTRGASFSYQPLRFDDLLSVLDYYAFLAIGFDMDSYYPLGGTPYFQKAQQILQLAASTESRYVRMSDDNGWRDATFEPGKITRTTIISELLDSRFAEFRTLTAAYYLNAMDYLGDKPDEAKAMLDDLLTKFADFKDKLPNRSALFQLFFDAKFRELAELFRGYKNDKVWDKLKYNDPSRTIIYEDIRTGRR